jgi:predicted RNA-binding Zn-ribbon protein involved in translation (DUF1610 family)
VSIQQIALRYNCDVCGAEADNPGPLQPEAFWDEHIPEGWTALMGMAFQVRSIFGNIVSHLCPACSALTIGQFVNKVIEQDKAQAARMK